MIYIGLVCALDFCVYLQTCATSRCIYLVILVILVFIYYIHIHVILNLNACLLLRHEIPDF